VTWFVVIAVGLGSFAFRLAPLLLLQRAPISERTDRLIRHGGAAAITALIVLSTKAAASGTAALPTLVAVGTGLVLAARGASMVRLLLCGGGAYASCVIIVGLFTR
jgi:branched-subunit amino acid transport protein